jgi:hypothetical protein
MQELTAETRDTRRRSLAAYAAVTAIAVLILVVTTLSFYWLWSLGGRLDASGERRGLTAQLMRRKTAAISDLRDSLADGDFDRAERAAALLRQLSEMTEWYVSDDRYAAFGDDFRDALGGLDAALRAGDSVQLRSAYDRLAASCVVCHQKAASSKIDGESLQFFTPTQPPSAAQHQGE